MAMRGTFPLSRAPPTIGMIFPLFKPIFLEKNGRICLNPKSEKISLLKLFSELTFVIKLSFKSSSYT